MGNIFTGSEIVEMGIQIERNGRDFYNAVAKKSKLPRVEKVFKFLAGEEEKHIAVFQKILAAIQKYEPAGLDSDDYYAYMNALASEHIFTKKNKGAQVAKAIKSNKEAIEKGIGLEEDSIVFYQGMKNVVPEYDYKVLEGLIAQEQQHLMKLINLKKGI